MTKYRESRAPTVESIHTIDYSRRLELFEAACKVFAVPIEVRHVWSRIKFFFMVSGNADVLAVHGDEESQEEASERVSTVPGRDWAGSLQETLGKPSQCDNHEFKKDW